MLSNLMSVHYMPITLQTHDILRLLYPQSPLGYLSFPYEEEGFRKREVTILRLATSSMNWTYLNKFKLKVCQFQNLYFLLLSSIAFSFYIF